MQQLSAYYRDGSCIQSRACDFDATHKNLTKLSVAGTYHHYTVSLYTGNFEIDGVMFRPAQDGEILQPPFQLVFSRSGDSDTLWNMGWQALSPLGEKIERVMEIEIERRD